MNAKEKEKFIRDRLDSIRNEIVRRIEQHPQIPEEWGELELKLFIEWAARSGEPRRTVIEFRRHIKMLMKF